MRMPRVVFLYIGQNDRGAVVGLKNSKKLLEDLPNKIRDVLGIVTDVNLRTKEGLDYIEVIVHPSSYPVDYKGEYHYRSGSTKQLLTGAALTQFLMRKTGSKWDAVVLDDVTVRELDRESFEIFKREAKRSGRMTDSDLQLSDEELLNHLNLLKDGKLKRAAVLLFHRNPERWFTGVYTKIGKFTGSEIDYMDEVHGSLILQADRVIDLIYLKYLKAAVSYEKDIRVEIYPFAREAVREAYFNALCHSDWSGSVPIQIKIEETQMLISNICLFPEGWTEETLMKDHNSVPFNPDIANTFYRAGYIEAWGRGIKKIYDACKEIGAKGPEYTIHGHDVMVRFEALHTHESQEKSSQKSSQKIISLMAVKPSISTQEIADELGISRRAISKQITKLRDQGIIQRIGPDKGGHWEVNTELLEKIPTNEM